MIYPEPGHCRTCGTKLIEIKLEDGEPLEPKWYECVPCYEERVKLFDKQFEVGHYYTAKELHEACLENRKPVMESDQPLKVRVDEAFRDADDIERTKKRVICLIMRITNKLKREHEQLQLKTEQCNLPAQAQNAADQEVQEQATTS